VHEGSKISPREKQTHRFSTKEKKIAFFVAVRSLPQERGEIPLKITVEPRLLLNLTLFHDTLREDKNRSHPPMKLKQREVLFQISEFSTATHLTAALKSENRLVRESAR
jgi:hypothetical protein